jgi:hypothetical protein
MLPISDLPGMLKHGADFLPERTWDLQESGFAAYFTPGLSSVDCNKHSAVREGVLIKYGMHHLV